MVPLEATHTVISIDRKASVCGSPTACKAYVTFDEGNDTRSSLMCGFDLISYYFEYCILQAIT